MSYVLTKKVVAANASAAAHHKQTVAVREAHNASIANPVDAELWAQIDTQTAQIMLPVAGEALYALLFPLAKTVAIQDIGMLWRKAGGDMEARSSVDGQHVKPLQSTASEWDGTIVPVHSASFYENWREASRNRFQFAEDQAAATRAVRARIIDDVFNGTAQSSFKNLTSQGIRNNPNVQALDLATLGVDFESATLTWALARKGILAIIEGLTGDANGAMGDVDILINGTAYFNLLQLTVGSSQEKSFLEMLRLLPGVKSIQKENKLGAKEVIALIASQEYIAPIVGAAVTTYAQVRAGLLDNYNYTTWAASGLQIKSDTAGRSGVLIASGV